MTDDRSSIELKNLAILNHLRHPNIVELLSSYKYGGRYNLIFPLADGGDLADLLTTEREQTRFRSDRSLLVALAGLASAIEHVHDFVDEKLELRLTGCHYDFRPRNILVSGQDLLLADFGLSHFKDIDAVSGSKTMFRQGADCYLAPECEDLDNFKKFKVGRASDIWSFGCILAELLVYMAYGPSGVKQFKESRAFTRGYMRYAYFHCGFQPNPGVEEWLNKLADDESWRTSSLVSLIKRMLSLSEECRPKAREVTLILRVIVISEVSHSIDDLFERLDGKGESLEVFLQLQRFKAWKYGIGIIDLHGEPTVDKLVELGNKTFESIVQFLTEMEDCLRSISFSQGKKMFSTTFPHPITSMP
jgi:serine/threonine protein kinase